ncbi:DUF58 domain-containing protein [Chloroflexota bacterium]
MISLRTQGITTLFKIYVVVVLIIATVLSPLALSFVPVILLVWHLYSWRWPINDVINLLTGYFMFFSTALLFTSRVGPFFSLLIALPVLIIINHDLEEIAESLECQTTRYIRQPTSICIAILLIAISVMVASLLLGSIALLLACAVIISYLAILGVLTLRQLSFKPVEETQVQQRMVAGTEDHLYIKLETKTKIGGLLFLESPYEWLKLSPDVLSLKQNTMAVKVSLSPSLSGPSIIKLHGKAIDRWGLIQVTFELEPIQLYVIPRARYAAWLAKKYLAGSQGGTLPITSNFEAAKPTYGLRRGIEYYGSQLYQPGDSLNNIDWKHSLRYNELISKEFTELHGQPAIILINLAIGNTEEADKLAYNIIVTAISLAQENIPTVLATYNNDDVKLITSTLQPIQLVAHSLKVAQEMVTFANPIKYLKPPDVARLRANINRLRFSDCKGVKVLSQLLQFEYKNLRDTAKHNPATKALTQAFTRGEKQSNIVIISHHNHDAEALAFNTFNLTQKGNKVITIQEVN